MAALTAPRNTWYQRTRLGDTLRIPMAAGAVIFQGGIVCVNATGYAVAAADTADYKTAGVAVEDPQNPARSTYDNSAGGNGDMHVVVKRGRFRFPLLSPVTGLTPAQAMLFAIVYVADDQSVSVHRWDVTNDIRCGHIVRLAADTLALDPQADFGTDEVEIELSGEPFEYEGTVTTAAPTTTTTTAQA